MKETLTDPNIALIAIERRRIRAENARLNPPDEMDEDEPCTQYIDLQIARRQQKEIA